MYKHTEYPTIPNAELKYMIPCSYVQEKLDGANVRVIVPKNGDRVLLGTRKVVLYGDLDYKKLRYNFESKLSELALENLKPLVDAEDVSYDEFVIYGELIGIPIFKRVDYKIDNTKVFFYDLRMFSGGKAISLPWDFGKIQDLLSRSKFDTIPVDYVSSHKVVCDVDNRKSFLNNDQHVEGIIVRQGEKIYKCKSNQLQIQQVKKKKISRTVDFDMYGDVKNKYAGFHSMTPIQIVSCLMEELIENYREAHEEEPPKKWIWNNCAVCFKKFFPDVIINKSILEATTVLLEDRSV